MGNHIVRWSYWIGVACAVIAVIARVLNLIGAPLLLFPTRGNPVGYRTFLDGALLFFVISIATAEHAAFVARGRQP